jgi:hypothetical protein
MSRRLLLSSIAVMAAVHGLPLIARQVPNPAGTVVLSPAPAAQQASGPDSTTVFEAASVKANKSAEGNRVIALLMTLALGQSSCVGSAAMIAAATERAAVLDLQGATARLAGDLSQCADTAVAYWYLHGLISAREAYRVGGSPESLESVKAAIGQLAALSAGMPSAEIARVVLLAASSAAQSERDEMGLLLVHALDLEKKQRSAGLPGAPIVTAHEVAGDLWLQVHRFDDARQAYRAALEQVGPTRRVVLGLARTALRQGDVRGSCVEYRKLVGAWPPRAGGDPPELAEAAAFLRRPDCRMESTPRLVD